MHVLVAEDDLTLAALIVRQLRDASFETSHARSGAEAIALAEQTPPDVVVLDRMLPEGDGLSVLRHWRSAGLKVPVLLLTALDGIDDRVEGLDAGADDYVGKPFAISELIARVNALFRRSSGSEADTRFEAGGIEFNLLRREARWDGKAILLQPREFRLLEELARNVGETVTRQMLLERVWGFRFDPQTNIVETHMSRMRAKLAECGATDIVETVRGVGYRMVARD